MADPALKLAPETQVPDLSGHFGVFGGRFVSETLMPALEELDAAWRKYLADPDFLAELDRDRPDCDRSPITV